MHNLILREQQINPINKLARPLQKCQGHERQRTVLDYGGASHSNALWDPGLDPGPEKKKLEGTTGEKGKVCDEKAALYQR